MAVNLWILDLREQGKQHADELTSESVSFDGRVVETSMVTCVERRAIPNQERLCRSRSSPPASSGVVGNLTVYIMVNGLLDSLPITSRILKI
jgi:hypothetical protein